jgi:acetyl esterase/lipase
VKVYLFLVVALLFSSVLAQEKILLWPEGKAPVDSEKFEDAQAEVSIYKAEKPNGMAIVICPGGGYGGHAINPEGFGIAKWLNKSGITGVVLKYRLPRHQAFVPLLDLQRTMRYVRSRATELNIDKDKIGVMGFSAGGHLASSLISHFDEGKNDGDQIDKESCRPAFGVLIYPVISMGENTHKGSKFNLLGENPMPEQIKYFSSELQVTKDTPPCFFAHADDDKVVVPANSQMMHEKLIQIGVKSEYVKLPYGGHGLNGYKGPMWETWQRSLLEWLKAFN